MSTIVNLIINRLKTSSIYNNDEDSPNIILFSDVDVFPEPPYVVVKPETGLTEGTRSYRIIVHMQQGQADELEEFTLNELDSLLLCTLKDSDGAHYRLQVSGYSDITPSKIDNSYFMERMYTTPITSRR